MTRQRIVLTGATGLIGRHLVPILAGTHGLWAVSRNVPSSETNWVKCDLNGPVDLARLPEQADAVIYLAQSEHFRDFPERAAEIFEVNVANVQRMLQWAHRAGVRRFILASSGGIYGHGESAFREDDVILPTGPLGFYLASKQCSELLTESYATFFTVIVLRFFFVYGPGQRRSMLVPRLIDSVHNSRPIVLQGPDGIRLNPIYVSDAVAAISRALRLEQGQKINVAGPQVLSLRELVEIIGTRVGRQPVFDVRTEETPRHLVGDTVKMRRLLGVPTVGFERGLAKMLEIQDE